MAAKKWDNDTAFPEGGESKVGDKVMGLRADQNFKYDFPGTGIRDSNENFLLKWKSVGGNATDFIETTNGQDGIPVKVSAVGASTDIGIDYEVKGLGVHNFLGLFTVNGSSNINEIIDDDTMASATDTNIPTSESVVAFVSTLPSSPGGTNTQIQYNNGGLLGGDTGFTTDGVGNLSLTGSLNVDNLRIDGNTLSSTDTNGNINLTPDGTGVVNPALLTVNVSVNIDEIIDDDTMVAATATNIATAESIVQYVQDQTAGVRERVFGVDPGSTYQLVYRVRTITGGGNYEFTFQIPSDFVSLTELYLVATPSAGAAGPGKNIDLTSAYGTIGESTILTQEANSIIVDTGAADVFFKLDLSSVCNSLKANDTVGIRVSQVAVGGNILYFTLNLGYQA